MAARYHFRCDFLPEVREFIRDTALNKHDTTHTGWARMAPSEDPPPPHGFHFGTRARLS